MTKMFFFTEQVFIVAIRLGEIINNVNILYKGTHPLEDDDSLSDLMESRPYPFVPSWSKSNHCGHF